MKKALSLLLALVMCLSLAACGGESNPTNGNNEENSSTEPQENGENSVSAESAIIGAWNMEGQNDVFVFSDDGEATRGDEQHDWWYDKEAEKYFMSFKGLTFTFGIEEDESGRFITLDGVRFYYVENYDPEALEAEYTVDANDAQLVYNIYMAQYQGFTENVTMEKFLLADVNGDGVVDVNDAAAIVSFLLA